MLFKKQVRSTCSSNQFKFLYWWWHCSSISTHFDGIVFQFQSATNPTSPRFVPLFEKSQNIAVVSFRGLKIPKTDRLVLGLFNLAIKVSKNRIAKYHWLHTTNSNNQLEISQFLHIDDPIYSPSEYESIKSLISRLSLSNKDLVAVFTNNYSAEVYKGAIPKLKTLVIEQGYTAINRKVIKYPEFSCVYISPFIDYRGDKHESHSTWGALTLIDEILPRLFERDPSILVHLIGKLGKNAELAVQRYSNTLSYGFLTRDKASDLLNRCHLGLYPRTVDHKRSVQKIFEYIGAGLPIVTFDLVDTEIVKTERLGISVTNSDEFIDAIMRLKNQKALYKSFENRVKQISDGYSWETLAKKLDKYQENLQVLKFNQGEFD